jgi:hypothetical protein
MKNKVWVWLHAGPSWKTGAISDAMPFSIHRGFPAPSMTVFFALQALDVLTTLIGLQIGAKEGTVFIARMLELGPLTGLLISKALALTLVAVAFRFKRPRVVVFLNFWFAAVVTWNLMMIVSVQVLARS